MTNLSHLTSEAQLLSRSEECGTSKRKLRKYEAKPEKALGCLRLGDNGA